MSGVPAHANGKEAMATSGSQSEPARPKGDRSPGSSTAVDAASSTSGVVALSSQATESRLGQLWQFPLLLASLCLFAYAGYRLIDPQPGPTIDQQLDNADKLLRDERGEAATEVLRAVLLLDEKKKLSDEQRGRVNLYLSHAVQQVQQARKLDLPANHQRIVEYTLAAEKSGIRLDAASHQRLAQSYDALGKPGEAVAAYRRAIAEDPSQFLLLCRKVIALLIAQNLPGEAEAELKQYLATAGLADADRSWAIGAQSRLLVDRMMFSQARELLLGAIRTEQDLPTLGLFHYRLGYCDWKLGDDKSAERYLRLARNQLQPSQSEDAEAALLLGKILLQRQELPEAISFFNAVIVGHPDASAAILARLGRGIGRIDAGVNTTDAGMEDLAAVAADIASKPSRQGMVTEALASLARAGERLIGREDFSGALELLALEQSLQPAPSAEFFARMSRLYERHADQLRKAMAAEPEGPERVKKWHAWRDTLVRAADAAVAQSRALTVDDDTGYGEALWRGIELYDRAGSLPQAIGALELFVAERPTDSLAPEALLRLGKAYHAAGQFDNAIETFKRNQFRHEQTLAAQKSGVPLAKAYIAKGPTAFAKAEDALQATLQSPLLTPDADEFRQALLELAELYYRTNRFEDAVAKLEELTSRYPQDEAMARLQFLMADSYRKSAALLALDVPIEAAAEVTTPAQLATLAAQRKAAREDRLRRARRLYDAALDRYRAVSPATEMDQLYFKLASFYRADCAYDVGDYEEAIKLYDAAALRFQDDASALTAYVQIVNAHAALGRPGEARRASERARWLLQRMPPDAFKEAQRAMPQAAWENWVKWTSAVDATAGAGSQP